MKSLYELKPRFQELLRPYATAMARSGISPNFVTLAALGLAALSGLLVAIFPDSQTPLLMMAVVLFVRMALNAIDGMLAREHGQASPGGQHAQRDRRRRQRSPDVSAASAGAGLFTISRGLDVILAVLERSRRPRRHCDRRQAPPRWTDGQSGPRARLRVPGADGRARRYCRPSSSISCWRWSSGSAF